MVISIAVVIFLAAWCVPGDFRLDAMADHPGCDVPSAKLVPVPVQNAPGSRNQDQTAVYSSGDSECVFSAAAEAPRSRRIRLTIGKRQPSSDTVSATEIPSRPGAFFRLRGSSTSRFTPCITRKRRRSVSYRLKGLRPRITTASLLGLGLAAGDIGVVGRRVVSHVDGRASSSASDNGQMKDIDGIREDGSRERELISMRRAGVASSG